MFLISPLRINPLLQFKHVHQMLFPRRPSLWTRHKKCTCPQVPQSLSSASRQWLGRPMLDGLQKSLRTSRLLWLPWRPFRLESSHQGPSTPHISTWSPVNHMYMQCRPGLPTAFLLHALSRTGPNTFFLSCMGPSNRKRRVQRARDDIFFHLRTLRAAHFTTTSLQRCQHTLK